MIKVTIDLYSGRPNPEYTLPENAAEKILKEVALNKGAITEIKTELIQLGFRGIQLAFESDYLPGFYGLPASFSIANGASILESKGREIAETLLNYLSADSMIFHHESILDATLNRWISKELKNMPTATFPRNVKPEKFELEDTTLPCPFEKVAFEPDFWNQSDHVMKNNCYNFATNRRTDSFAQPGRATGQMYSGISCDEVTRGAIADGSHMSDSCLQETEIPRFLMALVVAPGPDFIDYHWYRQCSDGNWAHKPGQTPARSTDNSNRVITDPSIADRGPYTQFCGYMLAPKSIKIQ